MKNGDTLTYKVVTNMTFKNGDILEVMSVCQVWTGQLEVFTLPVGALVTIVNDSVNYRVEHLNPAIPADAGYWQSHYITILFDGQLYELARSILIRGGFFRNVKDGACEG
jgi:hypothetical protein